MEDYLNDIKKVANGFTGRERRCYLIGIREAIYLAVECQRLGVDPNTFPPIQEFHTFVEGEIDKLNQDLREP